MLPGQPLHDGDYPAYSMSAASGMLGVTPAFLRGLGAHGLLSPGRSQGGHRRYSQNELHLASRARQVVNDGFDLVAACRIVALEHELAAARATIAALQAQLGAARRAHPTRPGAPPGPDGG
ncbi:MerR family transcriptional regulator [Pilimelia terevasa]|uniref:MerR family transcriptional regulator n=1 Tax=Pilimelia terevasa TaxID=53372 RepID=A0A8J3FIG0_9ACTN|nr:MerR family transcriptional regulator [Pilimelia terevasa]GGK33422.1 MerR family transcriptional regulator [Pilimelia terevasa]